MTRLATISTVKAPTEQLERFVRYHLAIGVDEVILYFDDPADEAMAHFADRARVTPIACSDEHWRTLGIERPATIEQRQIANVNAGTSIARERGCDWVSHIDSDELIGASSDVKAVLGSATVDCLRFELLEAVPQADDYAHLYEPTLFRRKPTDRQLRLAAALGCRQALFEGEYLRGHRKSKMAFRVSERIRRFGIHEPIDADVTVETIETSEIQLLHFDCVGLENWKQKWRRRLDGTATAEFMRAARSAQFTEYVRAAEAGDAALAETWRRLHTIPGRERVVLFALGMLTRSEAHRKLLD